MMHTRYTRWNVGFDSSMFSNLKYPILFFSNQSVNRCYIPTIHTTLQSKKTSFPEQIPSFTPVSNINHTTSTTHKLSQHCKKKPPHTKQSNFKKANPVYKTQPRPGPNREPNWKCDLPSWRPVIFS